MDSGHGQEDGSRGLSQAPDMTTCIALLRGINVGRAKRIAMADLRKLVEELGYAEVRTLLQSGNIVFQVSRPNVGRIAAAIEASIQRDFGFPVPVIVHTARELTEVVAGNPLRQAAGDPSKFLVAFVSRTDTLDKARLLHRQAWAPDAMAVGRRAVYLWCANGIIESKLMQAFARATADAATTRNWATVLKLQAAATGIPDGA
jgi:uncharacterized protein (DUF1697 family)